MTEQQALEFVSELQKTKISDYQLNQVKAALNTVFIGIVNKFAIRGGDITTNSASLKKVSLKPIDEMLAELKNASTVEDKKKLVAEQDLPHQKQAAVGKPDTVKSIASPDGVVTDIINLSEMSKMSIDELMQHFDGDFKKMQKVASLIPSFRLKKKSPFDMATALHNALKQFA